MSILVVEKRHFVRRFFDFPAFFATKNFTLVFVERMLHKICPELSRLVAQWYLVETLHYSECYE
ncbi:MAG: hypothetical protein ABL924_03205 [Methyloglobulus sp.]